jgi:hypothetical protein
MHPAAPTPRTIPPAVRSIPAASGPYPEKMNDLPENLLSFLQAAVPSFPAAELLIFLTTHRGPWKPSALARAVEPMSIAPTEADEYLALFKSAGLLADQPGGLTFAPATPELEAAIAALTQAYNERPVTLIRTINALADHKLQSFADAFKLKKD